MERLSRKKILYAGQEISYQRVLKIQQCLLEGKFKAECLVIIIGVDSKFCNGSRNLLEKILPGFEETASICNTSDEFAEEAMDDLVICIKKESVEIYCNPQNYDCLMSYAACWNNLVVHCLDKTQYENHEDLTEDLKILSFVRMVEGCSVVAVPYYFGVEKENQAKDFDPMFLEQWPLIQAFALEGIGGGGFFTMKHEVIDASELLDEALSSFDPLSLEVLLTKQVLQFEKQWKALIKSMDVSSSQHLASLTEDKVVEPLSTYYQHATGEHNASTISEPCVRFGIATGRHLREKKSNRNLGHSGIDGSHAYHMICYGRDSKGILSCKRTYFFENQDAKTDDGESKSYDKNAMSEVRLLQKCYNLAVDAVDVAIDKYCKGFSIAKCREEAVKSLIDAATKMKNEFIPTELDIEVIFNSRDQLGRVNCSENGTKTIEISIHNIPSIEHKGASLGSVAFSETFFTSSINFVDESGSKDTECILLTHSVPRFASWLTEHTTSNKEQETNLTKSFGNLLIDNATCLLISGTWPILDMKEVSIWCLENGLNIHHAQFGHISIPLQFISSWETFDNDSTASVTLIIIHPNSTLLSSLPFWIAKDSRILLAFQPRSKAHVGFYDQAFHIWKESRMDFYPLKTIDVLPKDLANIYSIIQEYHKVTDQKETVLARLFRFVPNLKRFFKHFEISSTVFPNINKQDFKEIMADGFNYQIEKEISPEDSDLLVTIITGLPGSDAENVCKSLTSLARDSSRWFTLKVPAEIRDKFNVKDFQEQLLLTYRNLTHQKGRPQASSRKQRRLILLTQGFINIKDIIQAIQQHPDVNIRSKLKIGSVNCCINPADLFLFGRSLVPLALEQCKSGYVNTAIFTGCIEANKAKYLASTQRLIRQCNHNITFIIAKAGEVVRTPDVETILSDTAFNEVNSVKARALFKAQSLEDPKNAIQQITIPFYQPVDRSRFIAKLKDMKGQLAIENLFGDVLLYMEGRVGFIDHDEIFDFKWCKVDGLRSLTAVNQTLSPRPPSAKSTSNQQVISPSKYHITFFGLKIQEKNLREMIQNWRKQEKSLISRNDISVAKLKEIENRHKFDPLPQGWFFNGSQYVSFEGDKEFKHPSFNKFVDDYMTSLNEDIRKYNEAINHVDMFSN